MSSGGVVMALKKQWTDPDTSVVGEYWEMVGINYDHRNQFSEIKIGLWVNKTAYDASKSPIKVQIYRLPAGAAPQLAQGAYNFSMGYAQTQAEFDGAEVVE